MTYEEIRTNAEIEALINKGNNNLGISWWSLYQLGVFLVPFLFKGFYNGAGA